MKLILDAGGVIVYPAFGHWRYGAAMLRPPVADTLASEAYLRRARGLQTPDARGCAHGYRGRGIQGAPSLL